MPLQANKQFGESQRSCYLNYTGHTLILTQPTKQFVPRKRTPSKSTNAVQDKNKAVRGIQAEKMAGNVAIATVTRPNSRTAPREGRSLGSRSGMHRDRTGRRLRRCHLRQRTTRSNRPGLGEETVPQAHAYSSSNCNKSSLVNSRWSATSDNISASVPIRSD